jgi:hypothetical protein
MQSIRHRLEKHHPNCYARLEAPSFQDSNLSSKYWRLQSFVWWRHATEVKDAVLHALCVSAVVIELVEITLFFRIV